MKKKNRKRSLLTTIMITVIPFYVAFLFIILFFIEYRNISHHNKDTEDYFKSIMDNYSISSA
ncbi:MAG: hypothetical protein ABIN35_03025, partial [candidate division WOR-3 bacterium]